MGAKVKRVQVSLFKAVQVSGVFFASAYPVGHIWWERKKVHRFLAIGEFVQLFWMDGSATNLPVTFMN